MSDGAEATNSAIEDGFKEYSRFVAACKLSEYGKQREESSLGCSGKVVKRFLVFMNLLFVMGGAGLVFAGLYLHNAKSGQLLGDALSYAIMALGIIIGWSRLLARAVPVSRSGCVSRRTWHCSF